MSLHLLLSFLLVCSFFYENESRPQVLAVIPTSSLLSSAGVLPSSNFQIIPTSSGSIGSIGTLQDLVNSGLLSTAGGIGGINSGIIPGLISTGGASPTIRLVSNAGLFSSALGSNLVSSAVNPSLGIVSTGGAGGLDGLAGLRIVSPQLLSSSQGVLSSTGGSTLPAIRFVSLAQNPNSSSGQEPPLQTRSLSKGNVKNDKGDIVFVSE